MIIGETLEAQALDSRDKSSLGSKYRHLGRGHGNEGWASEVSLRAKARWAKLEDTPPQIPLFALTVPFELPQRRWKASQFSDPVLGKVRLNQVEPPPILADEAYLPGRKGVFFGPRV